MKRKLAMMCVLALTATTAFSAYGCGGSESDSGKIQIRFATWDVAEDVDLQQSLVDKFNEEHDDIEVTLEAYGSEFDTKISAGMGSGDTPDVMYMWNYPSYSAGLEPLDEFIAGEGEEYKADFYEALWDYNSLDGATYGIPIGFTTHCLFFNKDIFDEAGIEYPTADWTWDDLQTAAETITDKTGVQGFAFQMKPDPYDFEMYLWSNGTAYCDEEGNLDGSLNSDASKEVFQMFQDMEKAGYATATEGDGTDEFRAGNAAMYIYGSWSIDTLNEDGVNYGVTTIPAFADAGQDSVSILSSSGLSMAADCENKEAAWEFIKYWTSAECNIERIGTELPVLNSVVESEGIMDQEEYAPFYTMLEQSEGHTPASFIIESWSETSESLELSFEQVFNPSSLQDVNEVLDGAAK